MGALDSSPCQKEDFIVPKFLSLCWISDWLFLLSSCSPRTMRQTGIEDLLIPFWALQHDTGCSKGAHCCVHRSWTCINPSIFVFPYSIDLSINSIWRNPAHHHPCWTGPVAPWFLFPGISQLGVLAWQGAIPLYQLFFHQELQLMSVLLRSLWEQMRIKFYFRQVEQVKCYLSILDTKTFCLVKADIIYSSV